MSIITNINFTVEYEHILLFISNKYNINLCELKCNLEEISKNTKDNFNENINYDINRCKAYVIKPKEKEKNQCTRQHKIDGFCNLHYNLQNESKLKFGFIKVTKKPEVIEPKNIDTSNITKPLIKKLPSVQRILLEGIEYKINPLTSYVYDFHSNTYLGKLDSDYNIIKEYEN